MDFFFAILYKWLFVSKLRFDILSFIPEHISEAKLKLPENENSL